MAGGERAEEVYGRTMRRIEMIKSVHPDIEVHWECEIKTQLLDPTTGMKKFFDEVEVHALSGLFPHKGLIKIIYLYR